MSRTLRHLKLNLSEDELAYLGKCARIRGVAPGRLVKRLIGQICKDQLVLSVLDDDSKPVALAGEGRSWRPSIAEAFTPRPKK